MHLPLIKVVFPANVSILFSILIPIVMFDFIDPEYSSKLLLVFDEQDKVEFDQMADLGYETHNSILNLGSICIFTSIYFAKFGLLVLLKVIHFLTNKGESLYKSLLNQLVFGEIITIVLEAYFEILVTSYLNLFTKKNVLE